LGLSAPGRILEGMRQGAGLALAGIVALLAGCGAIIGLEDTTTIPAGDAGPSTSVPEASIDASEDASVANGDAEAGVVSPCSGTFSDTFGGPTLGAGWDTVNAGGASLTLDTTDFVSPPSSLKVDVSAGNVESGMVKLLPPKPRTICLDVRMRASADLVSALKITGQADSYVLRLTYGSGTFVVSELLGPERVVGLLTYANDWTRIRLEIALPQGAGKGTIRVYQDDKLALQSTIGADGVDLALEKVIVGARVDAVTGRVVHYDDLSLFAK
jgi:hypothetical protein